MAKNENVTKVILKRNQSSGSRNHIAIRVLNNYNNNEKKRQQYRL